MNVSLTISNSSAISKESAFFNFPTIPLSNYMENLGAQDSSTLILIGFDYDVIIALPEVAINKHRSNIPKLNKTDYQVSETSCRVLKLMQGLAYLLIIGMGLAE